MSGYYIQTQQGKQGPLDRDQLAKLVKAGKLPLDFDVEDSVSGLLISVGDIVPAAAAASPPPPPSPTEPTGPELVIEDAELSPVDFAPSLKAVKGVRKKGDKAALRQAARPVAPPPIPGAAPAVRPAPARGGAGADSRRGVVRSAPSRGGRAQRAGARGNSGAARGPARYRRPASRAPWIVSAVLVIGVGVAGYFFWDDIDPWASPLKGTWVIDSEAMIDEVVAQSMAEKGLSVDGSPEGQIVMGFTKTVFKNSPMWKKVSEMRLVIGNKAAKVYQGDKLEEETSYVYQKLEAGKYRVKWEDGETVEYVLRGDQLSFRDGDHRIILTRID